MAVPAPPFQIQLGVDAIRSCPGRRNIVSVALANGAVALEVS